jgi:hypothetical protein
VSCTNPIAFPTLVALWTHELSDEEAAAVDEHLFGCDACAAASEQLGAMLSSMGGLVPPVLTAAQRDAYLAAGKKLVEITFDPGQRGEAFFARELDLMVLRLRGDVATAERVDLEILDGNGQTFIALEHVPFDASRGEVLVACQQHFRYMDDGFVGEPEFRLTAHEGGTSRRVGSYIIKHVWPPL